MASASAGPTRLRDRNRAIERDDGRRLQPLQRRVKLIDSGPVGLREPLRLIVQPSDGGLHLIRARPAMPHRLFEKRQALCNHGLVPEPSILIFKQYDRALVVETRICPRVLQQHERGTIP